MLAIASTELCELVWQTSFTLSFIFLSIYSYHHSFLNCTALIFIKHTFNELRELLQIHIQCHLSSFVKISGDFSERRNNLFSENLITSRCVSKIKGDGFSGYKLMFMLRIEIETRSSTLIPLNLTLASFQTMVATSTTRLTILPNISINTLSKLDLLNVSQDW